jgi:phosphopentomutase
MKNKLVFIFLDGLGLGPNAKTNPFTIVSMPTMFNLINAKLINEINIVGQDILVKGIDACLGVKGIPQSATGQTSLFTGYNSQAILGYHLMAYPNDELISLINKRSILKYAKEKNIKSIFANSYSDKYFYYAKQNSLPYSVTTHCVLAAQIRFKTFDDLIVNKAVHWDITNNVLQDIPNNTIPIISSFQAGKNLINLTNDFDLVLYECFLPDLIGHKKDINKAVLFLKMFDEFLRGIMVEKNPEVNILISSDHGNLEDLSTGNHTENVVPLIVIGNLAPNFSAINSIDEIFEAVFFNVFDIC